jgi:CRP-like cAMP-binding protein
MLKVNEILKKVPFFQTLGKESMDFIVDRLKFHNFEKGVDVVKIGEPGDTMYIIVSGEVDVLIQGADGKENKVASIGEGSYFGEMALMTGEPRSATIRTNMPCEMFSLDKDDFDIILEKYPSISLSLGKIMSQRLRQTLAKASEIRKGDASGISGPKGNLKQKSIMDLFVFCEENSITGKLIVVNSGVKAIVNYNKGNMMRVEMEGKTDTDALDELLTWTEGTFEIQQEALTLDGEPVEETPEEETEVVKNEIVVIHNSAVVKKIIERSLTTKNWLVTTISTIEGGLSALNQNVFAVILDAKLPDGSAEDFIKKANNNDIFYIVMAFGSQGEKYKALEGSYGTLRVLENNDISSLVKLVEELKD